MQAREPVLQPQPGRDQDLVVAAATGVDPAAGIAETLDQSRFDRRMAVLEAFVQHEIAVAEILGEIRQLDLDAREFVGGEDADPQQPVRVRAAGLDIEQEEFAIEHHVFTGEEALDALVDFHAGFLPEKIGHGHFPSAIYERDGLSSRTSAQQAERTASAM